MSDIEKINLPAQLKDNRELAVEVQKANEAIQKLQEILIKFPMPIRIAGQAFIAGALFFIKLVFRSVPLPETRDVSPKEKP